MGSFLLWGRKVRVDLMLFHFLGGWLKRVHFPVGERKATYSGFISLSGEEGHIWLIYLSGEERRKVRVGLFLCWDRKVGVGPFFCWEWKVIVGPLFSVGGKG
jgi:hypothetical protein